MSYILDALKKIEHDKNIKHSDGRFNISGDLFSERKQAASKSAVWKIVLLVGLASLVTCGVTWFVVNGRVHKSKGVDAGSSVPVPSPVTPPAAAPAQQLQPQVKPTAQPATVSALRKQKAKSEDGEVSAPNRLRSERNRTQSSSVQTVAAPADIKLSGIAWQDERSARRAVVNGFLLKEGAVVSGATISEIHSDKVRFSSAVGTFEIRLDALLPAEVKR